MPSYVPPRPTVEEIRENLRKDGGRKVMDGGNPYEDDVESDGVPYAGAAQILRPCTQP